MTPTAHSLASMPPCSHRPRAYSGPSKAEVLAMRREFLTPALLTYYKEPIMVVEGTMQWLFDETGRRYLDGFAGIVTVSVGHSHPAVIEAAKEQLDRLQHTTTIYLHPTIAQFAKQLASTFPKDTGLGVCYFVNSGSEANDLAMLMSRLHTGSHDFIALRNAYHGMTTTAMGMSALSTWRQPVPLGPGIHHARLPDCFRGTWAYDDLKAGEKYAEDVRDLIQTATCGRVAGFIAEPIQGVGGTIELPPGYLQSVYATVRAAGGLCISDEVQTGFGRTGDSFWAFEHHGVTPDIVTMAKGIGNGAPLACCCTTAAVAKSLAGRLHFNTYGGNPISMAQGLATLDVIMSENLQRRCADVGGHLLQGLRALEGKHALIGDVRGRGLMLGVELVKDRSTKEPAREATAFVHERMKDLGVLVGKGGLHGNVLRIKPPMCIDKADCDFLCAALDQALSEAR